MYSFSLTKNRNLAKFYTSNYLRLAENDDNNNSEDNNLNENSSSSSASPDDNDGYETDFNRSFYENNSIATMTHPVTELPEDQLRNYTARV